MGNNSITGLNGYVPALCKREDETDMQYIKRVSKKYVTKTTMATVKAFIRKNKDTLWINVKSEPNGTIDGCASNNSGFKKAVKSERYVEHTLGIYGFWIVGSSRDYIQNYEDSNFTGFEISNCCGRFIIAIRKV